MFGLRCASACRFHAIVHAVDAVNAAFRRPAGVYHPLVAVVPARHPHMDRRLHPLVALDLPADVDLEAGVRRVGPLDRPPQVLLDAFMTAKCWPALR